MFCGTPRRIRTSNLLIRSQVLYPVELWALCGNGGIANKQIIFDLYLRQKNYVVAEREGFEPSMGFPILP